MIVQEDHALQPEAAFLKYRALFDRGEADYDTLINTLFVSWRCTDFPIVTHHRISDAVVDAATEAIERVGRQAMKQAQGDRTAEFWVTYIQARIIGGAIPRSQADEFQAHSRYADPLILFLLNDWTADAERYRQFIKDCAVPSLKHEYMRSFLTIRHDLA